jgi:nitrogen fixation NifU-like protein
VSSLLKESHMLNLYQEILMDHYRNPRNNGTIAPCHFSAQQRNSSCGDEVTFMGVIRDGRIAEVAFAGKGCVISQAAASLLSEKVVGMSLEDILALDKDDLVAMLGMQLGPVRLLCGLLSLTALQNGIREYQIRK